MGNSNSNTNTSASINVCFADCEKVFNMQQNTFSNYMLFDIRNEIDYNKSHIDQASHLKFVDKLSPDANNNDTEQLLHKKWLKQLIKLHQCSASKSKITFYIIDDHDHNDMRLVKNVCLWLTSLHHNDEIAQINVACYYYLNFTKYQTLYPFMCSDNEYYEEGRLFPTQITPNVYLSNWGIASDGSVYKILHEIQCVINCTRDHPNVFVNDDNIHAIEFLNENQNNPMFKRQNDKIEQLRTEFNDVRLNYLRVPVIDTPQNDILAHLQSCCNFIQNTVHHNHKTVLIHCRHGQSRSVSIVAAWLIYNNKMNVQQALQLIKNKRPRSSPNQGFIRQLHEWYNYCNCNSDNHNYTETIQHCIRSVLLHLDLKQIKINQVTNIRAFANHKVVHISLDCEWRYTHQENESVKGTLNISDVTQEKNIEEWRYKVPPSKCTGNNALKQTAIDSMMDSKSEILQTIHRFIEEFYQNVDPQKEETVKKTDILIEEQLSNNKRIQNKLDELGQMQEQYDEFKQKQEADP